jgi:hypothetical protein
VQGGGAALAPLGGMVALRALRLAACHLGDGPGMAAALCSAPGLTSLRVEVSVGGGGRL